VYRQRETDFANLVGIAIEDAIRIFGLPHNIRGRSGSVWYVRSIHQSNGKLTQMASDGSVKLPRFAGSDAHTLATFFATHNKPLLTGAFNVVMH